MEFDTLGSLATPHESQGSDMGLFGGLLGWEADDARLPESAAALRAAGIQCEIRIAELHDPHPNTYRLTLRKAGTEHLMVVLSTGGRMIEVIELDGAPVTLYGDYAVTVLDVDDDGRTMAAALAARGDVDDARATGAAPARVIVSAQEFLGDALLATLRRSDALVGSRPCCPCAHARA